MAEQFVKLKEAHEKEIIELTQKLIQIPSITGHEKEIILFLKSHLHKIGFDEVFIDGLGNLIGRIGSGKKILAFDGHVDTVELGDKQNWDFNPLNGEIHSNCIHGRGSCDQKGGLAAAIYALKLLKEIGIPNNLTVYLIASIQEETFEGMNWQHIVEEDKIKPHAVVLTEPSNLMVSLGHRGRMDIKIKTKGLSSHGANPDQGINAVYKMQPIIAEIEDMNKKLPLDSIFGKGSIAVTDISSSTVSLNAVPFECVIHLDRRLGQKDTKESVLKELRELPSVHRAEAEVFLPDFEVKTYTNMTNKIKGYYPTWTIKNNHQLIEIASNAFQKTFLKEAPLRYWLFSTNGVATMGIYKIPTFGFGPGDEKLAHTYEERVEISQLNAACLFYLQFIIAFAERYKL